MNATHTVANPVNAGTPLGTLGDFSDDWIQRARLWIARQMLDPRARYMADACDLSDLEQREREWDRFERRRSSFFSGLL